MLESEFITAVSSIGFPAVIAFYVLHRVDKSINNNTAAISALKEVIILCPFRRKKP